MAGTIWEVRTTETYDVYDGLWYAEPIFHINTWQFGVMNDIHLGWWPLVDPTTGYLVMDRRQDLSGKNGGRPAMRIKWHETDAITFIAMHPDYPYANINFNNGVEGDHNPTDTFKITADDTTIYRAAPDEKLNNAGANSLEDFFVPFDNLAHYTVNANSKTDTIKQQGGNGFLWVNEADENFNIHISASLTHDHSGAIKNKGDGKQTWAVQGKNGLAFHVTSGMNVSNNIGRGIGYRSWVHTPGANKRKLTFSMVINGFHVPGLRFSTKIGYPGNWQIFETAEDDVGQKHLVFHYDPKKVRKANLDKPLAIDWVYEWHYDKALFPLAKDFYFDFGCMTVHEGWWEPEHLNLAFNSMRESNDYGKSYGFAEVKEYAYRPFGSVIFPKPMATDNYRLALTSSKTMKLTEKSRYGFSYTAEVDDGDEWSFTYFAKVVGDISDVV
jgi:hypothetical protein